jgi:dTDP-4-dehydrorhamnose 3,5-epimerase
MRCIPTAIADVLLLEPRVFEDDRGFFMESYNRRVFAELTGQDPEFVQDNHSVSHQGVLRGIHYQVHRSQGKLVRVVDGEVFDVAVDLRSGSDTYGRWVGANLSESNKRQLWIPKGFGHGFLVLSERAVFLYKTTDYYSPENERTIRWDDPDLAIAWPSPAGHSEPLVSPADRAGMAFREADRVAVRDWRGQASSQS